jgi:hypothetical protein
LQRQTSFKISAAVIGVLLACLLVEITLRILGKGYGSAPMLSDPILHHVNPKNYEFVVHDPAGEYGGHTVHYDDQGFVTSRPSSAAVAHGTGSVRIAMMGDSFVAGTHIPYAQSFYGLLEPELAKDVVMRNFGVSSYSPALYTLQWRLLVEPFRPTHLFVLLYNNDIRDDADYTSHGVRGSDGQLQAVPGPGNTLTAILRHSYLVRLVRKVQLQIRWWLEHRNEPKGQVAGGFIEENPDITPVTTAYMEQLVRAARAIGCDVTLMAVPSRERALQGYSQAAGEPEHAAKWAAWAQQRSIRFIDLVPAFRNAARAGAKLFFEKDVHMNAAGHRVTAEAIRAARPDLFDQNPALRQDYRKSIDPD